jgi:hypothetical protein
MVSQGKVQRHVIALIIALVVVGGGSIAWAMWSNVPSNDLVMHVANPETRPGHDVRVYYTVSETVKSCDSTLAVDMHDGVESIRIFESKLINEPERQFGSRAVLFKDIKIPVTASPGRARLDFHGEFRCNLLQGQVPTKRLLGTQIITVMGPVDDRADTLQDRVQEMGAEIETLNAKVEGLNKKLEQVIEGTPIPTQYVPPPPPAAPVKRSKTKVVSTGTGATLAGDTARETSAPAPASAPPSAIGEPPFTQRDTKDMGGEFPTWFDNFLKDK